MMLVLVLLLLLLLLLVLVVTGVSGRGVARWCGAADSTARRSHQGVLHVIISDRV